MIKKGNALKPGDTIYVPGKGVTVVTGVEVVSGLGKDFWVNVEGMSENGASVQKNIGADCDILVSDKSLFGEIKKFLKR